MKKLKKIFSIIFTAMLGLSAVPVSSCAAKKRETDVFILAGQSNMEGYAKCSSLDAKYRQD